MKLVNDKEAGFSLLSLLIAVMIIGIMAALAVPKFNAAIAMANTSRVESDLSEIDAAIAMYKLDTGKNTVSDIKALSEYLTDVDNIKPPKGTCYLKAGGTIDLTDTDVYEVKLHGTEYRAVCREKVASDFGKPASTSSSSGSGSGGE